MRGRRTDSIFGGKESPAAAVKEATQDANTGHVDITTESAQMLNHVYSLVLYTSLTNG